jgi:hypothetical protein
MDTLSITLTGRRVIDGYVQAANNAGLTPESLALEFLTQQGIRYADGFKIGLLTSAAFVQRFTPAEYGAILAAAVPPEDATPEEIGVASAVASLVTELTSSPMVSLDDPRLGPGLELLVSLGLLLSERVAELLAYERPTPEVV